MKKVLSYVAILVAGIVIGSLIVFTWNQINLSNSSKNTAYSAFGENGVKNYEAFLKISSPDIEGSSQTDAHFNEIVIEEFGWGENTTYSGVSAGLQTKQDFYFVFEMDPKASPALFKACASATAFSHAELSVHSIGDPSHEFLTVSLQNVYISSYQTIGNTYQGFTPIDKITINFAKMTIYTQPMSETGEPQGPLFYESWDFELGG